MKLSELIPNPLNRILERGKINNIKTAIKESNEIKPLVYTEVMTDRGKEKMLTDGHHRYVALKEMGYKEAPAVMADKRGIETAQAEAPRQVKKQHSTYMTNEDRQAAAQEETIQIRENRKRPEAQQPHKFKQARWTHPNGHPRCIECGDDEPKSGQCSGYESVRVSKDEFVKEARETILGKQRDPIYSPASRATFVKHPGHSDQGAHNPKRRSGAKPSKDPKQTFGRISSKQVDFIDQQVPGVKEYYNSLPKNKRPDTATDLVTQFEGLQARPKSRKKKKSLTLHTPSGEHTLGQRRNAPPKQVVKTAKKKREDASQSLNKRSLEELRDIAAKLNLTEKGYVSSDVAGLALVREDLSDELVEEHPGDSSTKPKKAKKMNGEYNSNRPVKNPEAHQQGGRN